MATYFITSCELTPKAEGGPPLELSWPPPTLGGEGGSHGPPCPCVGLPLLMSLCWGLSHIGASDTLGEEVLPFSFNETWITNIERNPRLNLRNAQEFYIRPVNFISLKRLPLFNFPSVWNQEHHSKSLPDFKLYKRSVKSHLLGEIIV